MLEFQENHVRAPSGRLLEIETMWVAEAERERDAGGGRETVDVVRASARSESRAWARLLAAAESAARFDVIADAVSDVADRIGTSAREVLSP